MPTCWKCGAEIPEGEVECAECQSGITDSENRDVIDWNKVKTVEEFRAIVKATDLKLWIHRDSAIYEHLKKICMTPTLFIPSLNQHPVRKTAHPAIQQNQIVMNRYGVVLEGSTVAEPALRDAVHREAKQAGWTLGPSGESDVGFVWTPPAAPDDGKGTE